MRLKIYDASWMIHYGSNSIRYKDYVFCGYPLGGVKYLVKHITDELYRGSDVIVCFDSRTDKNGILPGYKRDRPYNAYILSQTEFAYNMLMKCGIACLKEPNFEADDLVASAVKKFRQQYSEIVIISNDRDLAHNVFGHIRVEACSADGIDINQSNFSVSVAKQLVEYNTISAFKVLTGDSSDKISVFQSEKGISGNEIYKKYVDYGKENLHPIHFRPYLYSIKAIFSYFLNTEVELTDNDRIELEKRVQVIFPRIIDEVANPSGEGDLIRAEIGKLLSILQEDLQLQQLRLEKVKLSKEEFNDFRARAQVLRDGTFAVDHDCPVHSSFFREDGVVNMRLFD